MVLALKLRKVQLLSDLINQKAMSCNSHALAIQATLPGQGWRLYRRPIFNAFLKKAGDPTGELSVHSFLAKRVGDYAVFIDLTEGSVQAASAVTLQAAQRGYDTPLLPWEEFVKIFPESSFVE